MSEPGHWFEREPLWFKTAVFYEIHLRGFFDGNDDGSGDFRRARRQARLPAGDRRRLHLAAAVLPEPAARRRLRHRRLLLDPSRLRDDRRLQVLHRPGAPARAARDRRPRHEPHLVRPPVVPGEPQRPDRPVRRLVRLGRRRHALGRGADHLPRHRAVELDVGRRARPVLLAPLLRAPARPELRQPRSAGADAERAALLARPRARRLPARRRAVPLRARRDERREPAGDARLPEARARRGRRGLRGPRAARRGEPVARRRRRVLRRRRRVPHGVPLPRHAAHVHGRAPRGRAADHRDPRADAADPGRRPSGGSSCATTTS